MKLLIIAILMFTCAFPHSANGSGNTYKIIKLDENIGEKVKVKDDEHLNWKVCGDYFASAESTNGKIIHFVFRDTSQSRELSRVFVFGPIDRVIISIDKKMTSPVATIRGVWVTIRLSPKDFKTGLPCLANGTET